MTEDGRGAPERLWTIDEVAAFLVIPKATLYHWHHIAYGPKARKMGRWLRYDPDEVRRWPGHRD